MYMTEKGGLIDDIVSKGEHGGVLCDAVLGGLVPRDEPC